MVQYVVRGRLAGRAYLTAGHAEGRAQELGAMGFSVGLESDPQDVGATVASLRSKHMALQNPLKGGILQHWLPFGGNRCIPDKPGDRIWKKALKP